MNLKKAEGRKSENKDKSQQKWEQNKFRKHRKQTVDSLDTD